MSSLSSNTTVTGTLEPSGASSGTSRRSAVRARSGLPFLLRARTGDIIPHLGRLDWKFLGATLLACVAILAVLRDRYWRPFDDLVPYHAYGFAAASATGLWPNPVVARDIDVRRSRIQPYPHWPNGFFLLFEGVLRVFGRTQTVGRSFAILGTMLGFTLVVVSLGRRDWLPYATLPLLLLTSSGRDSIPFVFIDVAQYFWIGALLWIAAKPCSDWMFRAAMVVALLFNQLVLPYAAVIVMLRWM